MACSMGGGGGGGADVICEEALDRRAFPCQHIGEGG